MILALILKVTIFLIIIKHRQYYRFSRSHLFLQTRFVVLWRHHMKVLNRQMMLVQLKSLCQNNILRDVFVLTRKKDAIP